MDEGHVELLAILGAAARDLTGRQVIVRVRSGGSTDPRQLPPHDAISRRQHSSLHGSPHISVGYAPAVLMNAVTYAKGTRPGFIAKSEANRGRGPSFHGRADGGVEVAGAPVRGNFEPSTRLSEKPVEHRAVAFILGARALRQDAAQSSRNILLLNLCTNMSSMPQRRDVPDRGHRVGPFFTLGMRRVWRTILQRTNDLPQVVVEQPVSRRDAIQAVDEFAPHTRD